MYNTSLRIQQRLQAEGVFVSFEIVTFRLAVGAYELPMLGAYRLACDVCAVRGDERIGLFGRVIEEGDPAVDIGL
jgi:hypothetical protein